MSASCRQGSGANAPAAEAPTPAAVVEDRAFVSVIELFMAIICVVLFEVPHVAVSACKTIPIHQSMQSPLVADVHAHHIVTARVTKLVQMYSC
jgi:hypothetical protein